MNLVTRYASLVTPVGNKQPGTTQKPIIVSRSLKLYCLLQRRNRGPGNQYQNFLYSICISKYNN